jgi:hypothetical protein
MPKLSHTYTVEKCLSESKGSEGKIHLKGDHGLDDDDDEDGVASDGGGGYFRSLLM